jgi:hypothetical protein
MVWLFKVQYQNFIIFKYHFVCISFRIQTSWNGEAKISSEKFDDKNRGFPRFSIIKNPNYWLNIYFGWLCHHQNIQSSFNCNSCWRHNMQKYILSQSIVFLWYLTQRRRRVSLGLFHKLRKIFIIERDVGDGTWWNIFTIT